MNASQPHLEQVFQRQLQSQANNGTESNGSLPSPDSEYRAFARRSNAPEFSLIVILPTGRMRGFQYAHLDSDSDFTSECITLRFMGTSPRELTIHGRNMTEGFTNIHAHRCAWMREAAEAFADDDETIITRITITPLKPVETANQAFPAGSEAV